MQATVSTMRIPTRCLGFRPNVAGVGRQQLLFPRPRGGHSVLSRRFTSQPESEAQELRSSSSSAESSRPLVPGAGEERGEGREEIQPRYATQAIVGEVLDADWRVLLYPERLLLRLADMGYELDPGELSD